MYILIEDKNTLNTIFHENSSDILIATHTCYCINLEMWFVIAVSDGEGEVGESKIAVVGREGNDRGSRSWIFGHIRVVWRILGLRDMVVHIFYLHIELQYKRVKLQVI